MRGKRAKEIRATAKMIHADQDQSLDDLTVEQHKPKLKRDAAGRVYRTDPFTVSHGTLSLKGIYRRCKQIYKEQIAKGLVRNKDHAHKELCKQGREA